MNNLYDTQLTHETCDDQSVLAPPLSISAYFALALTVALLPDWQQRDITGSGRRWKAEPVALSTSGPEICCVRYGSGSTLRHSHTNCIAIVLHRGNTFMRNGKPWILRVSTAAEHSSVEHEPRNLGGSDVRKLETIFKFDLYSSSGLNASFTVYLRKSASN